MVYDMLGYCWGKNLFYSAKWRSLDITLLASFIPGWEHLNPVFSNVMPFLKENIMVYDMLGYCWGKNLVLFSKMAVIRHNIISILYSRVGAFKPSFQQCNAISEGKYHGVRHVGVLLGQKYVLFSKMAVIRHNIISILYSWVGAFNPSF